MIEISQACSNRLFNGFSFVRTESGLYPNPPPRCQVNRHAVMGLSTIKLHLRTLQDTHCHQHSFKYAFGVINNLSFIYASFLYLA